MLEITLIEGTLEEAGGYSVNGRNYVGEDHEALADEARMMACATGRTIEEALSLIMPAEHAIESLDQTVGAT